MQALCYPANPLHNAQQWTRSADNAVFCIQTCSNLVCHITAVAVWPMDSWYLIGCFVGMLLILALHQVGLIQLRYATRVCFAEHLPWRSFVAVFCAAHPAHAGQSCFCVSP